VKNWKKSMPEKQTPMAAVVVRARNWTMDLLLPLPRLLFDDRSLYARQQQRKRRLVVAWRRKKKAGLQQGAGQQQMDTSLHLMFLGLSLLRLLLLKELETRAAVNVVHPHPL